MNSLLREVEVETGRGESRLCGHQGEELSRKSFPDQRSSKCKEPEAGRSDLPSLAVPILIHCEQLLSKWKSTLPPQRAPPRVPSPQPLPHPRCRQGCQLGAPWLLLLWPP